MSNNHDSSVSENRRRQRSRRDANRPSHANAHEQQHFSPPLRNVAGKVPSALDEHFDANDPVDGTGVLLLKLETCLKLGSVQASDSLMWRGLGFLSNRKFQCVCQTFEIR